MEAVMAYITVADVAEARRIGKTLVEERLAACINILPELESWYWWQGRMENSREALLLAKTRSDLQDALQRRVVELHPYDCPCVLFFPLAGGLPEYLKWITTETKESHA